MYNEAELLFFFNKAENVYRMAHLPVVSLERFSAAAHIDLSEFSHLIIDGCEIGCRGRDNTALHYCADDDDDSSS